MNTSEIETLLEKFYEGTSSLQEEEDLRDYFRGGEIPPHLKSHQQLFNFYGVDKRRVIEDQCFEEKLTTLIQPEQEEKPVIRLHQNRTRLFFTSGIAATILLLVGLFFTLRQDVFNRPLSHSGITNPEIAYAETREALMLVSGNLNTGLKQVERLQMMDKAMKNIQLFNKFYQYQTMIINPDEFSNQSIKTK